MDENTPPPPIESPGWRSLSHLHNADHGARPDAAVRGQTGPPRPELIDPGWPGAEPQAPHSRALESPGTEDVTVDRNPTLRIDRPREVLAWLPYQLHFRPHESVVLASIRRSPTPDQAGSCSPELGLVARTDLGIIGSGVGGRQAQVEMSRHLQRDGAHRVLCALYTEQPFATVLGGAGAAGRTLSWWRTTPWAELGHTYLVGPERFRCVSCVDEPCCPHTGQPVELLANTEIAAWYVYHGETFADRREALVPDPHATDAARAATAAAARHHLEDRPTQAGTGLSAWQREAVGRWVRLVHAGDTDAGLESTSTDALGAVLAGVADTWVRDAALLWSGTGQLLGETLRDDVIDAVFSGRLRPHPGRIRAAQQALTVLSAHATDSWRAPVLTCQAWLAWWTGDGARANILLERALALEQDYSLARLLGTALAHGIPPGWVRCTSRAS